MEYANEDGWHEVHERPPAWESRSSKRVRSRGKEPGQHLRIETSGQTSEVKFCGLRSSIG